MRSKKNKQYDYEKPELTDGIVYLLRIINDSHHFAPIEDRQLSFYKYGRLSLNIEPKSFKAVEDLIVDSYNQQPRYKGFNHVLVGTDISLVAYAYFEGGEAIHIEESIVVDENNRAYLTPGDSTHYGEICCFTYNAGIEDLEAIEFMKRFVPGLKY